MEKLPVYILAGGNSSRFGSDKARAEWNGAPLIVQLAKAVRPAASSITVVAREEGKYEDLDLWTIGDLKPGLGPMGGLQTALDDMGKENGWFLLLSCDLAGMRLEWVDLLLKGRVKNSALALFRDERWHPFPGLYHTSIRRVVNVCVRRKVLTMAGLTASVKTAALEPPDDWSLLKNVNHPEDLE